MKHAVWDYKTQFDPQRADSVFDCMLAEFLLSQGQSVPSQATTESRHGVSSLDELADKQMAEFERIPSLYEFFTSIEMPMVPVLWQMEQTGIYLDGDLLRQVGKQLDEAISETSQAMKDDVGFEINLNSSVQIGSYLAEKLKVPLTKTKTGRYATNEAEISQYAEGYPFIQKLLRYREFTKLRFTYIESLVDKIGSDGRIHTSYSQVAANTGRLSSNNPNLQNIPTTSEFGQKIKSCFQAPKGKILISFDYSQQELRVLAHLSQEEALIKAFEQKQDVHITTATLLFGVDYKQVTSQQRRIAKTINFGIVYGMSGFGLSSQLHIPVEEAQKFINAFYKTYPRIRSYYADYLKRGALNGYVETILGRRRFVFEQKGQTSISNAMRRVLINYPIQGSAADLMKKAMITIFKEVVEPNPDCQLLLQISLS